MNQFFIATNDANAALQNAITATIKDKGWAFWHHFQDVWLVTTLSNDVTTSQELYEELSDNLAVGKETHLLVVRLANNGQSMTYYGHGPKRGWEWTKKYWGKVG